MYRIGNIITDEYGASDTLIESFYDDCPEQAAKCLASKIRQAKEDPGLHPFVIVDETEVKYRYKH